MLTGTQLMIMQFSETQWKSLRYFSFYRLLLALVLFMSLLFNTLYARPAALDDTRHIYLISLGIYFFLSILSFLSVHFYRHYFNWQLSVQVLIDVLVFIVMLHYNDGLTNGFGVILMVTLAGAGLVGQGRLVLFYAAVATLGVLLEQAFRSAETTFQAHDFFLAGLFSIGFFSVAVTGRLLGRRVIASEEMARQRGEELKNQTLINQRVIEEMQDGVLVLDQRVVIKQCNPRAEQLLGFSHSLPEKLTDYSSELVYHFLNWCEHANDMAVFINAPISGLQLRARFVATNSTRNEVLVFLEDTARVQAQAQQIKLAALGRLTGNIAHEIRNPLSAINHAGELLQEGEQDKASLRLLRIVLDNVKRVERIVSDVLELGRRDRSNREALDLREILPAFVEEYVSKEHIDPYKLTCEISGLAILFFDRTHLHQVLSNLVSNAFRHSQERSCTVILRVHDTRDHKVNIHVIDDGSGIDATLREQLFEPFFTTHSRGTGLGLYIARELCQANGGQLELLNTPSCTDFCISGRAANDTQ